MLFQPSEASQGLNRAGFVEGGVWGEWCLGGVVLGGSGIIAWKERDLGFAGQRASEAEGCGAEGVRNRGGGGQRGYVAEGAQGGRGVGQK